MRERIFVRYFSLEPLHLLKFSEPKMVLFILQFQMDFLIDGSAESLGNFVNFTMNNTLQQGVGACLHVQKKKNIKKKVYDAP